MKTILVVVLYGDEASSFIFTVNQVSLKAEETIRGKRRFERTAHASRVDVKTYREDNGIFKSESYQLEL